MMRIAVALSGGLDSSFAAVLLRNEGHQVIGITALLGTPESAATEQIYSAQRIAELLEIELHPVDLSSAFNREVIDPFCAEYSRGRTPNPCIRCNSVIKFGLLRAQARTLGCEAMATGHYAYIGRTPEGRYYIARGADTHKDQSYFLFMLTQEVLPFIVFPLGKYCKQEVRDLALKMSLPITERPESQEICFIPDNDYPGYIERRVKQAPCPGDIVDTEGNIIGTHNGIHRFTIGQRRGLGISSPHPLYVIGIDAERNRVIAGPADQLLLRGLIAAHVTHMKVPSLDGLSVYTKTRSSQKPFASRLEESGDTVTVRFETPQSGITPGQAAVFYDNDGHVLGGGWIERGLRY